MKTYVGTDIIEVERIKKALENENFKKRVFSQKEIEYCESKNQNVKYQHYAARFAAKEAVYKAISSNIGDKYKIEWRNIEVLNDKNGRPTVKLIGLHDKKDLQIDISITHIKEYALATAILTINNS